MQNRERKLSKRTKGVKQALTFKLLNLFKSTVGRVCPGKVFSLKVKSKPVMCTRYKAFQYNNLHVTSAQSNDILHL